MRSTPPAYTLLWPLTPWLYPLADLRPASASVSSVEHGSRERIDSYLIRDVPARLEVDAGVHILVVHDVKGVFKDERVISLSIAETIRMDTSIQSNPRRHPDPGDPGDEA